MSRNVLRASGPVTLASGALEIGLLFIIITLTFDPTPTACLLCVDVERHLVSVGSGSGAHFDRCAYIIDLTQY